MLTSCPCNGEGAGAQCSQEPATLGVQPASEHQAEGGAHATAKAHMFLFEPSSQKPRPMQSVDLLLLQRGGCGRSM